MDVVDSRHRVSRLKAFFERAFNPVRFAFGERPCAWSYEDTLAQHLVLRVLARYTGDHCERADEEEEEEEELQRGGTY